MYMAADGEPRRNKPYQSFACQPPEMLRSVIQLWKRSPEQQAGGWEDAELQHDPMVAVGCSSVLGSGRGMATLLERSRFLRSGVHESETLERLKLSAASRECSSLLSACLFLATLQTMSLN